MFKYTNSNTLADITFFPVTSFEDNFIEGDETVKLIILSEHDEVIQVPDSQQTATITIIDDDCKHRKKACIFITEKEREKEALINIYSIVLCMCYYTAGELSIERGTYNVTENVGSIEICVVLTGGVMSVQTEIELEAYSNTANFESKWIIDVFFNTIYLL